MAWIYRIGAQEYLTQAERENNATEFYNYFSNYGATIQAICGMLGNIQWESQLNPGMKQTNSTTSGWGLIQWTPSTVLTNWCNSQRLNWFDGEAQCERIIAEGEGTRGASGYFLPTSEYPYSWTEFCALTNTDEATKAFLYERERAGSEHLNERLVYASEWHEYFVGVEPVPPTPPTPFKHKSMPLYMYLRKR